ncbi:MAG: arsenate reductase ArsC [Desulfovibrionaceae bacterium]
MHRVLFVCQHNSGRSVMAEAFLNALGGDVARAESAGLEPRPVNPLVAEVMAEEGIDVRGHQPRDVFELFRQGRLFSHVVTVCGAETDRLCPVFPGVAYRENWPFPDPAEAVGDREEQLAQVRAIRDRIKARIREFLAR